MLPILNPGDQILVDLKAFGETAPHSGEIVVAFHPHRPDLRVVKRVSSARPDGTFVLIGENPFDSTDFQSVPIRSILGRVTSRLP